MKSLRFIKTCKECSVNHYDMKVFQNILEQKGEKHFFSTILDILTYKTFIDKPFSFVDEAKVSFIFRCYNKSFTYLQGSLNLGKLPNSEYNVLVLFKNDKIFVQGYIGAKKEVEGPVLMCKHPLPTFAYQKLLNLNLI